MKEQGYHKVDVWLDAKEYAAVKEGAKLADLRVATFCRKAAYDAAVEVVATENGGLDAVEAFYK